MIQLNKSTQTTHISQNFESDVHTYNDKKVKIITVFTDHEKSIALVEDEDGELFEISKDLLK